jgi:hypothetical protein
MEEIHRQPRILVGVGSSLIHIGASLTPERPFTCLTSWVDEVNDLLRKLIEIKYPIFLTLPSSVGPRPAIQM